MLTDGVEGLMVAPPIAWAEPFIRVDAFSEAAIVLNRWIAAAS